VGHPNKRFLFVSAIAIPVILAVAYLRAAPLATPAVQIAAGSCDITAPGRIVAIGDVHGAYDKFLEILREAQLIDKGRKWIGGNATFVQTGDILDRGTDSRKALDLMRQLEAEAPKSGGRVVFLLGNHELMRMGGDFRYISDGEYAAFKSADAGDMRERLYQHLATQNAAAAKARNEPFDAREFRMAFLAATPLGSVEMQIAFAENGEYGKWLREHDIMARVNGTIFVHGGVNPSSASLGCNGINARARAEAKTVKATDPNLDRTLTWNADGPLWFRGIAGVEPVLTDEELAASLKSLGGTRIVIGHTVSLNAKIHTLYDGRVFAIDTGMLDGLFYPGGEASALEISGTTVTAIYVGKKEVIGRGVRPLLSWRQF